MKKHEDLKTKFDTEWSDMMSSYLESLERFEKNRKSPADLLECNFSPIKPKVYYFSRFTTSIINEDYHIFPVPKKLLDSIEEFALTSSIAENSFSEKIYNFNDILRYAEDWDYYEDFKKNSELLLKECSGCSIRCCLFDSTEGARKILEKYPNEQIKLEKVVDSFALIYTYHGENGFDACLLINSNHDRMKTRKVVQHELIHWMQAALNSHSGKSHGIFESKKFNITESQKEELLSLLRMNEIEFRRNFEYLFSGKEFEAWVANTCEEFEDSGMSLEEFKNIIENDSIFTDAFLRETTDKQEMLLFSRLCYLTTMNSEDKSDDRWWFLLEALKENENYD